MSKKNLLPGRAFPIWSADNTRFLLVFIISVALVYLAPTAGVPPIIIRALFLGLLLVVFRSRDDVFWLCWFLVVMNAPGRLFFSTSSSTLYRLPYYSLGAGVSLGFQELFLGVYLLKYLLRRLRNTFLFGRYFQLLLIYGAVTFVYSLSLGMNASNMISAMRIVTPWLWVLILPAFISDQDKLGRAFLLLAPFVFLTMMLTIQGQLTGTYLHDLLSGELKFGFLGEAESELVRISHAANLNFICMLLALYYISREDKRFKGNYLNAVLVTAGVFFFLSASRGWIIGMLVLLASVFFMGGFNFIKQTARVIVILGLLTILLLTVYPNLAAQSSRALGRLLTLEQLAEGDITAGGTLSRLSERGPRVMALFRENPVLGWGFSGRFFENMDGHVGNQNMLMQGGVVGYLIWMLVFIIICVRILFISRNNRSRGAPVGGGMVFLLGMLASFAIHSSSGQLWGFYSSIHASHLHWAWLLAAANVHLLAAERISPTAISFPERG